MIDDLAAHGDGADLAADLCVVGAGPAGLALAREFLGSRTSVIVVESGGVRPEPEVEPLKEGEAEGLSENALVDARGRGFGGTTALWAGQCIPLDDIDFERKEWVPHSGWPIGPSALSTYYARAGALLGIPGETYDERLWDRWRMSPAALDSGKLNHRYTAWVPQPDLGRSFRSDFARSRNVRVLLHANVTAIETNADGTAFDHLRVRHLGGIAARVRARACVLCCGGIENARLLLMSGDPDAGGVGNPHDNVGRFFQDHAHVPSAIIQSPRPRMLQERYSMFHSGGRRYLPKVVLAPAVQRAEGVLNCIANFEFLFADEAVNALRRVYLGTRGHREGTTALRRDLRLVAEGLPAAGATVYHRLALGRSSLSPPARTLLRTHPEQAPNRDSRVLLSRERDSLGSNKARVEWRLTELERRTVEVMARTVDAEFRRLGLAQSDVPEWLFEPDGDWTQRFGDSYHHIGTTRMADDPRHGVVDRDCQLHGVAALYLGGSSVFPTSGYANPTLTIVALSLRLADHLKGRLGAG
jgi:choline dehydrogenase-like flavoprotein